MEEKIKLLIADLEFDSKRYTNAIEAYPQKIGNEWMMGKRDMADEIITALKRILEGK